MKKNEDPEFFKNCLESNPLSENWILRAVSFFTFSNSIPILFINFGIQSSVYRMSKNMYFMRKPWIVYGSPGIDIASNELITKNEISSSWIHMIWIKNPIIKLEEVSWVNAILPPWLIANSVCS